MNIRARLNRLEQVAVETPPSDQLDLIVCVPVGTAFAGDRPPGVYAGADETTAYIVFQGNDPDRADIERLKPRLSSWGKVIVSHPY
ncbi:hypothetical protein [Fimbriiglobus ruber]|uniref:Uncharacterized protein n=1 Tax=Fimbriiglobus ruber TaxID=1908690 RepID=A0A225D7E4_9BACT|nr:hypothetical protein [Fimbriiglobus ruber]OWK35564.1 hypothetical protein FRUB_08127 [Fimbriiglobus ruber]